MSEHGKKRQKASRAEQVRQGNFATEEEATLRPQCRIGFGVRKARLKEPEEMRHQMQDKQETQSEMDFDVHYHLAGESKAVISPRTAASHEELSKLLLAEAGQGPLMIVGTYEKEKTGTVILGVSAIQRIDILRPR